MGTTRRWFSLSLLMWVSLSCQALPAGAQAPSGTALPLKSRKVEKQEWTVISHVTTLKGEPVHGATMEIALGGGQGSVKRGETNLKGEFTAEFSLNPSSPEKPSVTMTAAKDGYFDAWEAAELDTPGKTKRVELILREDPEDIRQLPLTTLIETVVPRLRELHEPDSASKSGSSEYAQAAVDLVDRNRPATAIASLRRLAQREPDCIECQTLFGLALLARGSWSDATRELSKAAILNSSDKNKTRRPEPFLILGVLDTWRGHFRRASTFLLQALDVEPANSLALQELGRVLLLEGRTKPAAQYLQKAIQARGSADAHFLRARALLEEGVPEEAESEMQAYLGGRKPKDLPRALRLEWLQMETRLRIESKGKTVSVVDLPLADLLQEIPDLQGLQPAASQDEQAVILRKVGETVKVFFQNFPSTSSVEQVTTQRLDGSGKVRQSLNHRFKYLLLPQADQAALGMEEYRTDPGGTRASPVAANGEFMITEGFASQALHFHPAFQSGSRFRYLGRQPVAGIDTFVVAFAQRPETAGVLEDFRTKSSSVVVLIQGAAWVDSRNYQIIRIRTHLLKPAPEIRLQSQTTDIYFSDVQFTKARSKFWVPREVAVTVAWNGRVYRNLHKYSDFQLFKVEAREKQKEVILPPDAPSDPQ